MPAVRVIKAKWSEGRRPVVEDGNQAPCGDVISDIGFHRSDVTRLLQLLSAQASYPLPETVRDDMRAFVDAVSADADYDPRDFGVAMTPGGWGPCSSLFASYARSGLRH